MMTIEELVKKLDLKSHPEGGFYSETYRSAETLSVPDVGERNLSTGIYFLLTAGNFSAFHRIRSDEMWHFYAGDPITVHILHEGSYSKLRIGPVDQEGCLPQGMVPAGAWFASEVEGDGQYSLVGCTVSPGFDFEDFELAEQAQLNSEFPEHEALIKRLTRS